MASPRMQHYRKIIRRSFMVVLVLAVIGTLFFGVRLVVSGNAWMHSGGSHEPIAGWMTPRYVVRSWQVPPEVVGQVLALEPGDAERKMALADIAKERGVDLDKLIAELTIAVTQFKDLNP